MTDKRIQYSDLMKGAKDSDPMWEDTLNRLSLVEHNNDGTHSKLNGHNLTDIFETDGVTVKNATNSATALAVSGMEVPIFIGMMSYTNTGGSSAEDLIDSDTVMPTRVYIPLGAKKLKARFSFSGSGYNNVVKLRIGAVESVSPVPYGSALSGSYTFELNVSTFAGTFVRIYLNVTTSASIGTITGTLISITY